MTSPEVFISFPNGHGTHLTPESGLDDHHDVHDHEQQQRDEREEMDRPRGLVSAEQRAAGPGTAAVTAGDIARPVNTINGAATKTTREYAHFCSKAVLGAAGRGRDPEAQVIDDVAPHQTRRKLAARGHRCERK